MATLISKATGLFSAAGTWALCSVAGENDSEAAQAALTTGNLDSSTFVLETNQVDAIAVKVQARPGATGTATFTLRNSTTPANVAVVTVNVVDFDSGGNGWYVIPLGLNHTPNGADSYLIRATTSAGALLTLYALSGNNWTRQVRRTTTQAPSSGDKLIVAGEHTGAGTGNSFVVTMDNTATTSFGPTVSGGPPQGITVNKRSTLTFSTSIAAYLKWKGVLAVYGGGTLNVGTSGARIGAASSAILEMDSIANVDTGLNVFPGGTLNVYGDNGRTTTNTLMTADKAIAATVIALASTAGWASGDVLAFASTTRTASECESKTILTVDSATQVTLTAGLTNAHSGTSPTQAEVVNLTRNVKIRGVSSLLQGYCLFQTTSVVNIDYCEFTQLGSATGSKRGIDVATTTGTCSITHCSSHDSTASSSLGFNVTGTSGQTTSTLVISNNVTYNVANQHLSFAATTGTWLVDSNVFIRCTDAGINLVGLADVGGTFTNNTMVGATGRGVSMSENGQVGTFSGNTCHSNNSSGWEISGAVYGGAIDSLKVWRNASDGLRISNGSSMSYANLESFGNSVDSVGIGIVSNVLFSNATLGGDSSFSTTWGVSISVTGGNISDIVFENSSFGVVSGIKVAHNNGDIFIGNAEYVTVTMRNTILGSSTEVSGQATLLNGSYIRSQKHDQTAGNHKVWVRYGTISADTTIFDVSSSSVRLTPNNASSKLAIDGGSVDHKGSHFVPVASGGTVTVSVRVRKSVVGDGTAYNGNQPRLLLSKNVPMGIASDTVLATASASTGAWETLTGTTSAVTDDGVVYFTVDCDGTTGWVNVDTWTDTGGADSRGEKFWLDGEPFSAGGSSGGGGARNIFIGGGIV